MKKILLDTDMGCDCDDVGALAVLCGAVKRGEAELLAVTHAIDNPNGLRFIKAMTDHYGLDIPLGRCHRPNFLNDEKFNRFIAPLAGKNCPVESRDSVSLLRSVLAFEREVTLITIGSFVNIAALLDSPPDEFSPLDGQALVRQSVTCLYSMAGDFGDPAHAEFNIECDIPAARTVAARCPVPIAYLGFEAGKDILTGEHLATLSTNPLLRDAYDLYVGCHRAGHPFLRPSWDPATVYCALYPENPLFVRSEPVAVTFDESGFTHTAPGGKDCFFTLCAEPDTAAQAINRLML